MGDDGSRPTAPFVENPQPPLTLFRWRSSPQCSIVVTRDLDRRTNNDRSGMAPTDRPGAGSARRCRRPARARRRRGFSPCDCRRIDRFRAGRHVAGAAGPDADHAAGRGRPDRPHLGPRARLGGQFPAPLRAGDRSLPRIRPIAAGVRVAPSRPARRHGAAHAGDRPARAAAAARADAAARCAHRSPAAPAASLDLCGVRRGVAARHGQGGTRFAHHLRLGRPRQRGVESAGGFAARAGGGDAIGSTSPTALPATTPHTDASRWSCCRSSCRRRYWGGWRRRARCCRNWRSISAANGAMAPWRNWWRWATANRCGAICWPARGSALPVPATCP